MTRIEILSTVWIIVLAVIAVVLVIGVDLGVPMLARIAAASETIAVNTKQPITFKMDTPEAQKAIEDLAKEAPEPKGKRKP